MNFPISSLPSVAIAANLFSYFVMMAIYVMVLLGFGIYPNLQWLEYIYYLFCMIVFMFAFSLFNSTISVLVRDYQFLLQSVTRLLFFLLPIFWDISTQLGDKHPALLNVIKLNPLFILSTDSETVFSAEAGFSKMQLTCCISGSSHSFYC